MRVGLAAVVAAAMGAGCKFPELPPIDEDAGGTDGPIGCTAAGPDPSCPASTPVCVNGACGGFCINDDACAGRPASERVCLQTTGGCVACDENDEQAPPASIEDECPVATAAVCDGDSHTCRPCEAHDECVSGVCHDGRCAPDAQVVHVTLTGADGPGCGSPASPCLTLDAAVERVAADPSLDYIHLAPSETSYDTRSPAGPAEFYLVDVYVVGVGASVDRNLNDGSAIEVSESTVTFDGLTIKNATGAGSAGITCTGSSLTLEGVRLLNNQGAGITSSCTLIIEDSEISGNGSHGVSDAGSNVTIRRSTIAMNSGVGVQVTGSLDISRSVVMGNSMGGISARGREFRITNNFIHSNGSSTSVLGGITAESPMATNKLEFNTIGINIAGPGFADGIICSNVGLTARNNIVIGLATSQHVSGNCLHQNTLVTPANAPAGAGNMVVPDQAMYRFVSTTDLHIQAGSIAAGRAQATGLMGEALFDIDGDAREPDGTTVDVGADEIP